MPSDFYGIPPATLTVNGADIEVREIRIAELKDGFSSTRLSIQANGVVIPAATNDGGMLMAGSDGGTQRHVAVDASGNLIVVLGGAGPTIGTTVLGSREAFVVLANADIFAADLTVPRDGVVNIEFITNTAGVFSLDLIRDTVTIVGELMSGATIQPDRWQSIMLPVQAADDLNLRISAGAIVTALISFQDKT